MVMSTFSNEDIIKLAQLSRLRLTKDEVAKYKKDLTAIMSYVERLQNVDISDLSPTSQVTGLTNVVRDDVEIDYGTSADELLVNAPKTKDHQFRVKRMVG
jgi:aspartyl-tRNA(Asn)/glutamyl-tRNA(Gln) amidotransferase subunit C